MIDRYADQEEPMPTGQTTFVRETGLTKITGPVFCTVPGDESGAAGYSVVVVVPTI
jgi:hypothetical protein